MTPETTTIFQTTAWENFKLATGYESSYRVQNVLVLQKKLPLGLSMLYSPMVDKSLEYRVCGQEFNDQIKKIAKENNSIFYRLELDIPQTPNSKPSTLNYIKSFEEMQPEHTEVLDLNQSEEDLLAGMKQKCRYNIKVSSKAEVKISHSDTPGKELHSFFEMYQSTAKRHGISFRGETYFEKLLEILGQKGYASVYVATAEINGEIIPLAAAIVLFCNNKAIYLFGSSSDEHKNYMAPYLLHWTIIKAAKERGCQSYDFFGVAPNENPHHPWAGVTRFKKQWGGEQVDLAGSYDLVLQPFQYQLFKIAEKIRR